MNAKRPNKSLLARPTTRRAGDKKRENGGAGSLTAPRAE
jgi:hypothetical protein